MSLFGGFLRIVANDAYAIGNSRMFKLYDNCPAASGFAFRQGLIALKLI